MFFEIQKDGENKNWLINKIKTVFPHNLALSNKTATQFEVHLKGEKAFTDFGHQNSKASKIHWVGKRMQSTDKSEKERNKCIAQKTQFSLV